MIWNSEGSGKYFSAHFLFFLFKPEQQRRNVKGVIDFRDKVVELHSWDRCAKELAEGRHSPSQSGVVRPTAMRMTMGTESPLG
jgi:hypothetical protein